MQGQKTFLEDLKHQYKYGGMTIKLIFANVIIFLIINTLLVAGRLTDQPMIETVAHKIFTLNRAPSEFIWQPWGLFTSIFAHFSILHLLFNMIFLYFTGRMFEQLFDQKRLFYTYVVAGVAGGILEILAYLVFPVLQNQSDVVVGASGSIMGLFIALAFHQPQAKVMLFGVFPVRLIWLAIAFLLSDFLSLGLGDGTAHFAHLGGAIIGLISIQNLHSSGNLINVVQRFGNWIQRLFSGGSSSKMKVKKGGQNSRMKTDEEYNVDAKNRQREIDRILDKISKSGYDSLTKKEKEFLFNQSKNG